MLGADQTITIIQKSYDLEEDLDVYEAYSIEGVSWFSKMIAAVQDKGLTSGNTFVVRIPESVELPCDIKIGDLVVHGVVSAITKQADLAGMEYFTVLSVGDNRRGKLPHIAIKGG
ncbi:DUF6751 family protein [Chakrabartyella piscis]|uniref:DUF6751 family protein n=1 Tax=Chakrabartyella piscis TaxID=2918914 RepID=UPI002958828D|nr:DUF6751 family protein [Chakrabartyella piscis]